MTESSYPDQFNQITSRVVQSEFLTITMRELRDAEGGERCRSGVLQRISDRLRSSGVGHFPVELPPDQNARVRLFRYGSPAFHVIRAVTDLNSTDDQFRQLGKLCELFGNDVVTHETGEPVS